MSGTKIAVWKGSWHFYFPAILLLMPPVSGAAGQYSYESLGGYVGGYVYNQFMRDVTAMHCPLSGSAINVKSDNDVITWAVKLFPPTIKKKQLLVYAHPCLT